MPALLLAPLITRSANMPAPGSTVSVSLTTVPLAVPTAPKVTKVYALSARNVGIRSTTLVELPATAIWTSRVPLSICWYAVIPSNASPLAKGWLSNVTFSGPPALGMTLITRIVACVLALLTPLPVLQLPSASDRTQVKTTRNGCARIVCSGSVNLPSRRAACRCRRLACRSSTAARRASGSPRGANSTAAQTPGDRSVVLRHDTAQAASRARQVDRVGVAGGEDHGGELQQRGRRPGQVEIDFVAGARRSRGSEIEIGRSAVRCETRNRLAEIDKDVDSRDVRRSVDEPYVGGRSRRRQVVVVQHQRDKRARGSGQNDRGIGRRGQGLHQRQQGGTRRRRRLEAESVLSGAGALIIRYAGIRDVRQLQTAVDQYIERRGDQRSIDHLVLGERAVDQPARSRVVVAQQEDVDQLAAALAEGHDGRARMLGERLRRAVVHDILGARRRDPNLEGSCSFRNRNEQAARAVADIGDAGSGRGQIGARRGEVKVQRARSRGDVGETNREVAVTRIGE